MFSIQSRWVVVAGLVGVGQLLACSSDTGSTGGTAGSSSGGAAAGTPGGGNGPAAGSNTGGNATTAGSASGGASAGNGTGGISTGGGGTGGGSAGAVSGGGGSGGAAAGSGGASGGTGGSGGGAAMPTAVANIMGLNGTVVTGTATFTQGATVTKLVLDLTACPDGVHSSHLHLIKDCGMEGNAAGGHWMPNGVGFGDYTCANGKGTLSIERPLATWTVGDPAATDVTKYAFMVHEAGDANSGARIGCGTVDKK